MYFPQHQYFQCGQVLRRIRHITFRVHRLSQLITRAAPEGTRPGIFYANAYNIKARPKWAMESLYLHEAIPGHHFQIALQQETEEIPRFRRFARFTA